MFYSYQLGSGEANILTNYKVNDGEIHNVTASRLGRDGELYLDGNDPLNGQSEGVLQMLNVKGRVYLGMYHQVDYYSAILRLHFVGHYF